MKSKNIQKGFFMQKFISFILLFMIFLSVELFADVKITLKPPSVADPSTTTGSLVQNAINKATVTFNDKLYMLDDDYDLAMLGRQKKLAKGMGNASAYSGNTVASFSGYEGYDIFAFRWGLAAAVVLPSGGISGAEDRVEEEKDIDAGAGATTAFNLGINLTKLFGIEAFTNRLYMNFKGFKMSLDVDDLSYKVSTYGVGINYQIIDEGGERFKLFKWTGLSMGTGFIYNHNKIIYTIEFDEYKYAFYDEVQDLVVANGGTMPSGNYAHPEIRFTPETQFGVDITTYTIPVEFSTSVRLLWIFNFSFGAGADLIFGKSEIVARSETNITMVDSDGLLSEISRTKGESPVVVNNGYAEIDGDTSGTPTFFNFKIMGGFGVCLGPIPVDVSVVYYPFTRGIAVNAGLGFVW